MPADSEPTRSGAGDRGGWGDDAPPLAALPLTWRPLGPRIAGAVAGGGLLVVMVFLWIGFDDETRAAVTPFQRGTVIVMFGIGYAALNALIRSRVQATATELVVVNGYRRHTFAWAEVIAVHLRSGAPWVTLDLADGNTISAMGIQTSDGLRARRAARQLRALVDQANAPGD